MRNILKHFMAVFVLSLIFGVSTSASAEEKISIDFTTQTLYVKDLADSEILVGYGSWNVGKKELTIGKEDVFDNTDDGIMVDLSHLNLSKENYITIRGISEGKESVRIIHTGARLKASAEVKYICDEEEAVEYVVAEVKDASEGAKKLKNLSAEYDERFIQMRTAYSDWITYGLYSLDDGYVVYSDYNLSRFAERGTTLYFRLDAKMGELDTQTLEYEPKIKNFINKSKTELSVKGAPDTATSFRYVDVGDAFPGADIKVKILKRAGAPKLTLDYAKRTVKAVVGSGIEARLYDSSVTTDIDKKEWKSLESLLKDSSKVTKNSVGKAGENWTFDVDNLKLGTAKKSILEIRTKATKDKPASLIQRAVIHKPQNLTADYYDGMTKKTGNQFVGKKDGVNLTAAVNGKVVKNDKNEDVLTGDFMASVKTDSSNAKKYVLTFSNGSGSDSYKYVIAAPAKMPKNLSAAGTVVKAGKTASVSQTVKKAGEIPKAWKDAHIYVYRMENKVDAMWASDYLDLGELICGEESDEEAVDRVIQNVIKMLGLEYDELHGKNDSIKRDFTWYYRDNMPAGDYTFDLSKVKGSTTLGYVKFDDTKDFCKYDGKTLKLVKSELQAPAAGYSGWHGRSVSFAVKKGSVVKIGSITVDAYYEKMEYKKYRINFSGYAIPYDRDDFLKRTIWVE